MKRIVWIFLTLTWLGAATTDGAQSSGPSLLEFLQDRDDRQWQEVPRKVLAFYYTWYGTPEGTGGWRHWEDVQSDRHRIASSTHFPVLGAYDSHDLDIIRTHIEQAKTHGVDGFICTWWGQGTFDDRAFAKVLRLAEANEFNATVYWETAPGGNRQQIDQAVEDLHYLLDRYGSHPAFLKVEGKPVIFVYGRVMNQVPMNVWPEIISRARADYGDDFLLIADGYQEGYARLFDGVHTYNIAGWASGHEPDALRSLSRNTFRDSVRLARRHGKVACLTVIPGYDDTKIRSPGLVVDRHEGATYRLLWEEAVAARPDWILITSWNEWHEGSEIEPSRENGDRALKISRRHAARFKSAPSVSSTAVLKGAGLSAERRKQLRDAFEETSIAVLPGFSGQFVFYLADSGLNLKEMTWEQVLDADTFHPANYPIVVYAGFENYTQTVHQANDVDQALTGYLKQGGLLISAASGPFPFYYNSRQETVNSAPKFGLPLLGPGASAKSGAQGWETPPEDSNPRFESDRQRLPHLVETTAFPESGDRRWRPAHPDSLAPSDVYLPLVRLKGSSGQYYGDAVVFIEHRTTSPRNAKLIYIWTGMKNAVEPNDLYFDILNFAARKATKNAASP